MDGDERDGEIQAERGRLVPGVGGSHPPSPDPARSRPPVRRRTPARGGAGAPAVERAQLGHGGVGGVVVRDDGEGLGRRVPQRPQEVGDAPVVLGYGSNDGHRRQNQSNGGYR